MKIKRQKNTKSSITAKKKLRGRPDDVKYDIKNIKHGEEE